MSIGVWIVENNQILTKKKTIFPLLTTLLALVKTPWRNWITPDEMITPASK
jgi:hypothetical protein